MTKNEEKRLALKRKIVDVTINLIRENGYDQVTMEGIAKACDITKRTLYKYYPVKEAILSEFIRMTFARKKEHRSARLMQAHSMREKVRYYMKELMDGVMQEPVIFEKYIMHVMKNLVSYDKNKTSSSGISDLIESIITPGYEEGLIDESFPHELVIDFFIFAYVEMTKIYYLNREQFDMETTLNICAELFIKGIARKAE